MPPALSDHGSSDSEDVPAQATGKGKSKQPVKEVPIEDEEEEEEEGSDVGEDEYVVEAIHNHRFHKGVLQFDVKWEGYDDPKDRTWEAEENMEGAIDVLNEYFKKIGGRPEPKGQKRKGRPSAAGTKSESGTPASSTKRAKADKEEKKVAQWSPPPGSWEHDVSYIDTVEQTQNPKTGELEKFVYLVWKNEQKTQHPLKHVYQKCPQKMLGYYESHLVFTVNNDGPLNGDDVYATEFAVKNVAYHSSSDGLRPRNANREFAPPTTTFSNNVAVSAVSQITHYVTVDTREGASIFISPVAQTADHVSVDTPGAFFNFTFYQIARCKSAIAQITYRVSIDTTRGVVFVFTS